MALVLKDRVRETSTTTGTGTFTLAGAVAGFQSFSAIGTGNSTYYTIVSTSDWEVGIGTWTSPDQLSRDTVLASTNAGALVTFGSGTKDVFLTFPAEGFAVPPAIGGTTPNTITGTTVTATNTITLPEKVNVNDISGVIEMQDGGDGYDYLNLYGKDIYGSFYGVLFPHGLSITGGNFFTNSAIGSPGYVSYGNGTNSGYISLYEPSNTNTVTIRANTSLTSAYFLTLPTTAGSNNQVLKTDGSGNLSWLDFGSPPAIGTTTPAAGKFTNISSATAPTNTVPALALTGTPNAAAGAKTGVLAVGPNFTATDKNIMASFVQDINDYTQIIVQNPNAGTGASADFIVNNDNTTGAGTYGDFGINSSTFSGANSFGLANATYLYSQGGDLSIGTASNNNIRFVINGNATDVGTITSTGLNSCAIGATTASTGSFTTLSATSVAATSSIARSGGKTSVISITNQATFTTGQTTLASQTAAANATWRIRAFGTFTAISNATARTAQVAVFWGSTQLPSITPTVLASTAQTTQWQLEFTVTASSTTAVWTAGQLMNRLNSATALALDTVTAASTTVTAGAQTIDLRFRVSTAVASEGWNVQSVIIERLV